MFEFIGTLIFALMVTLGTFCLLSNLGGWHELGQHFRAAFTPKDHIKNRSVGMHIGHYNNCVKIGLDETHLYIALPWVFSAFHPPLAIPFSEILMEPDLQSSKGRGRLIIDRVNHLNLTLSTADIDWIEARFAALAADT